MQQLHDGLWVHEDSMRLGGVALPVRMTVVRLASGGLWVHSPTELSTPLKNAVDDLGAVTAILAPSNGHNLWFEAWQNAYPEAATFVARGIPKKLPNLTGYEFIDEHAADWATDLDCQVMKGVPFFDECVFLHRPSRSLIVSDLVQNHRGREQQGFAKVISKLIMEPIGFKDICTAPPLRFKFVVKDRPAFHGFLGDVQAWDFNRIIVAHGNIIDDDAKATLARLCEKLAAG